MKKGLLKTLAILTTATLVTGGIFIGCSSETCSSNVGNCSYTAEDCGGLLCIACQSIEDCTVFDCLDLGCYSFLCSLEASTCFICKFTNIYENRDEVAESCCEVCGDFIYSIDAKTKIMLYAGEVNKNGEFNGGAVDENLSYVDFDLIGVDAQEVITDKYPKGYEETTYSLNLKYLGKEEISGAYAKINLNYVTASGIKTATFNMWLGDFQPNQNVIGKINFLTQKVGEDANGYWDTAHPEFTIYGDAKSI